MLSLGTMALGQTFERYKCNQTICYGTDGGPTHALFKEFQYQLNRAGGQISGWIRIAEDGFIGKNTLLAYQKLAVVINMRPFGAKLPTGITTFIQLSDWIRNRDLVGTVTAIADDLTKTEESPIAVEARAARSVVEAKKTTTTTPTDSAGRPVETVTAQEKKSRVGLVVGGLAALTAIGLVGVALYQRRR